MFSKRNYYNAEVIQTMLDKPIFNA